jgi:phosphoribosyl-ATP pyrophosphohydrolase
MTTPALKWTAQYAVSRSAKLIGDKITLPQTALEQLLSAATVTVVSDPHASTPFDPSHPYLRASTEASRVLERQQELPHPLTFRLVNPENGNVVYAGIREFSANEGEAGLSDYLCKSLGLGDEEGQKLTVHSQQLPKGTFVRFRPLEAGYDPEDWKALLERQLRNSFTTLTKNEVLAIQSGKEEYRFLVDEVRPDGDGICIVDTDLEVDIEALNEEQARETLKRRLEKNQKAPSGQGGSSLGGDIAPGKDVQGQVVPGDYVDYTLKAWDREQELEIELDAAEPDSVDLFVAPFSRLQRSRPREDLHVFAKVSSRSSKRIKLQRTNAELEGAEALYVSALGRGDATATFTLRVTNQPQPSTTERSQEDGAPNPDEVRCKNCHQSVPARTMMLHENFCYRNNVLCPRCDEVFKKSSEEWKEHWHCPHDEGHGSSQLSKERHDEFYHTETSCRSCGVSVSSVSSLARHRTSTCPEKVILCQFCHLLVPQKGPDDLDISDPEVVFSGLTPHELADGSSTTDCHMCGKLVRLRDMATHLRHHDLDRLSRPTPRLCRNINCGRTMDGVGPNGQIKQPRADKNDIGLCDACFGPLYNSAFDPDHRGLKRRVERRYLTQLLTGCGNDWCQNPMCKTGKSHTGSEPSTATSREALGTIKPILSGLLDFSTPLHFCTDLANQKRRNVAEMLASEPHDATGYRLPWCVAATEAGGGELDGGRDWLEKWAPRIGEES